MFLSICCACHFFHVHVSWQKNDRNIPSWRNLKSYWTWIPCVSSVVDSVQVRSGDLVPWGGVVMEMKYCLSWWWCLWWSGHGESDFVFLFPTSCTCWEEATYWTFRVIKWMDMNLKWPLFHMITLHCSNCFPIIWCVVFDIIKKPK